ncbi:MAG TPA: FIST N-terminal domain-containing protein [Gallionella sp.]|nr:FIST N-terminal domain-containing protein [Gallionella sp.]
MTIKKGASSAENPHRAVREVAEAIRQPDVALVIVFVSSKYDMAALGGALKRTFDCPVIGCTTAGEIVSGMGYREGMLIGISLSSPHLVAHPRMIRPLSRFNQVEGERLAQDLTAGLKLGDRLDASKMFAMLMVDGLSMLEEPLVSTLHRALGGVSLIGGAAGDDLKFRETYVYWDGKFLRDAAVVTLFETTLPFKLFHIQHFEPTDIRLAITECDSPSRTVHEINGAPAAGEYARMLGLDIGELNSQTFAAHPVMLKIEGEYFVRSIQRVNPDGSLKFYCAVENGQILTVGRGKGLVENLEENLAGLRRELPTLKAILGCDCILRRLELKQKGLIASADKVLDTVDFFGFSTYGEQFNGVHVNQTLTGIALGE